ncbi:MAG TPA: response regulator transcription factor [bacterium]|jgi:two-component system alkaline phosphatase synthesis response regulator PhoP|nr:response regulator transcription factor [bacterium]HNT65749.1 response regulator transcription factor [bacterium]HOX85438.1 response regulator transcription factor [bacterium]HPG44597.1 response regulator transcription factor [bacterium]HPM97155.1 response regulator transcription factor [bacterium]
MAKKILIVDDERDIIDLLKFNLEKEGYETLIALDGEQALDLALNEKIDLVLLDIMLPGKDGREVLRELRQNSATRFLPIIFLTAKDSEMDEVIGLELGADDYIVKPISILKLLTRIKTVLRKSTGLSEENTLQFGDLEIDPQNYTVKQKDIVLEFTKKEFDILCYLAQRSGRVVSRETLLNQIWGQDVIVIDRTIDVHIRKIREKLGPKDMLRIETIKGVGYRFKGD